MLSNSTTSTPRPRPPAKVRRAPSINFPPPPPYAPRLDMLLDSPLSEQAQIVASPGGVTKPSLAVEEWMQEKSRDELSTLLLKADGMIKSKETELGLTSALCKSLYQDNMALKSKREALMSRFPSPEKLGSDRSSSSPFPSPTPSPRPSPAQSPTSSPHYYTVSLPQTPHDIFRPLTPPTSQSRHVRRVSVTPEELAHLSDQNAELLSKLEKLEEESEATDHAGKRKLRKLEKEIQGLRDELEKTRSKGIELEEKTNTVLSMHETEIQRKRREEREERIRGLREKSNHSSDPPEGQVKDFAPPPELPRSNSLRTNTEIATSPPPTVNFSTKPQSGSRNTPGIVDSSQESSLVLSNPSGQPSVFQMEYAIISQLLTKIRELEVTNAQISKDQQVTADKFRSAQRDAESLRRAYDSFGGDARDLRVISLDNSGSKAIRSVLGQTITFNSLRRTIDGDISHLSDDVGEFAQGIRDNMQSTTRSIVAGPSKPPTNHKSRKSVVGLFDSEVANGRGPYVVADYLSSAMVSPSLRHASPSPIADLGDLSLWSTAATEGLNFSSPTMSSLGLSARQIASEGHMLRHTLGSELGSEFGDDWGENAGNHHLRTSSLYDLTALVGSEASPTPGASSLENVPNLLHLPSSPESDADWEDTDDQSIASVAGSLTPLRNRGLQLLVDPPTPCPPPSRPAQPPGLGLTLEEPRRSRNYRLSQTVRARTNRWVEGRYHEFDVPSGSVLRRRRQGQRASDASMVFSETFETVVRQMSFTGGFPVDTEETEDEDGDAASTVKAVVHQPTTPEKAVVALPNRQQGFVGFVLEVWLWLQFVIVVVVFLWAMARRGPKDVLKDAERRKSVIPAR